MEPVFPDLQGERIEGVKILIKIFPKPLQEFGQNGMVGLVKSKGFQGLKKSLNQRLG
jgi:hypothetical protein